MNPTRQFTAPRPEEMPDHDSISNTIRLRPELVGLPRWARWMLKAIIAAFVALAVLALFSAIVLAL